MRFQLGADLAQSSGRTLAGNRMRASTAGARQGKVWLERFSVAFKAQRRKRFGNRGDKFLKKLVGFDSDPEDARRLGRREESCTAETDFGSGSVHLRQGALNLAELLSFAKKLQGDVKCLRSDPADVGRKWTHFIAELSDPPANVGVDI